MLKVICITEGCELKEGAGQQKKPAPALIWVGLLHRSTFKITSAGSIKSSGLCIYRGVSMGEQQEARCKRLGSPETSQTLKIIQKTCF